MARTKEGDKVYYQKNKEKRKLYARIYRKNHPDISKNRHKNPEYVRKCAVRYKAWGGKNPNYERLKVLKGHGLSLEDYKELYNLQDGKCAICHVDFSLLKNSPPIDHDHTTGKVRGLLCSNCNTALGLMKDDMGRLQEAIDYLAERQE
jgi:hypothetical protein